MKIFLFDLIVYYIDDEITRLKVVKAKNLNNAASILKKYFVEFYGVPSINEFDNTYIDGLLVNFTYDFGISNGINKIEITNIEETTKESAKEQLYKMNKIE